MRGISYLILFHLVLTGCKKDKLEGEKEIFVGLWKHVKTVRDYYTTSNNGLVISHQYSSITPAELGYITKVEFVKRGKLTLFSAEKKINTGRVLFVDFRLDKSVLQYDYRYNLYLNNTNGVNELSGFIKQDTLIINEFPLSWSFNGNKTIEHKNYFVRE